jgi:organic hydroperoxide reductase OsmC/OhrA
MSQKTYEFTTTLRASGTEAVVSEPPLPALAVDTPKEFGGAADRWTPEHLLVASVSSCFFTTYRALARRQGLQIEELSCRGHATVTKGRDGLTLTGVRLAVEIEVSGGDLEKAHALVPEAERRCLVSRALNVPVKIGAVVTSRPYVNNTDAAVEV